MHTSRRATDDTADQSSGAEDDLSDDDMYQRDTPMDTRATSADDFLPPLPDDD